MYAVYNTNVTRQRCVKIARPLQNYIKVHLARGHAGYGTFSTQKSMGRVARQRPSRFTAKVTESPPPSLVQNSAQVH